MVRFFAPNSKVTPGQFSRLVLYSEGTLQPQNLRLSEDPFGPVAHEPKAMKTNCAECVFAARGAQFGVTDFRDQDRSGKANPQ